MPKIYFTTGLDLVPVISRLLPRTCIKGWKKQNEYTMYDAGMSFFTIVAVSYSRTVPFNPTVVNHNDAAESLLYKCYSVRYGPGLAVIPKGYGTELSVLWDEEDGGRTANEVAAKDGPWYSCCWPSGSTDEMDQLVSLINNKIPVAEERRTARK
jgi:hypothetical protein